MRESETSPELFKLVENEISLTFTFLSTAQLASSEDHKQQALRSAIRAYETAEDFAARVPTDQVDPTWDTRLRTLQLALAAYRR